MRLFLKGNGLSLKNPMALFVVGFLSNNFQFSLHYFCFFFLLDISEKTNAYLNPFFALSHSLFGLFNQLRAESDNK
jgi:hypothetical protein